MADHFYSTNKGAMHQKDVTFGSSTGSGSVELRIHDGDSISKIDALNCLNAIKEYIIKADAPA